NQTRQSLNRRTSLTARLAHNRARYAASSSPFSFVFSIRCHRGFCPAELSFIALDAAFESKPARLRHVISVRYEVFPKTWNVCGKFFVETFQESKGGTLLGKLIHEGEPQHERVQVSNHVVPHDGLHLPPLEFRSPSAMPSENH